MPGTVVLIGGEEFDVRSQALNEALLRLTGKDSPHIMILPVAAQNPGKVARNGVHYLGALGGIAEWTMTDTKSISDASSVPLTGIETANVIYLTDGSPLDAITSLADTEALAKVRWAWGNGAILVASGAGAMALCTFYWDGGVWERGLGLLKGIVVMPHHQYVIRRFSAERLHQGLAEGYTIVGLDDATGVIISGAGQECLAVGDGVVTLYRAAKAEEYSNNERFILPSAVG